jgi:hypothetical protein
MIKKEYTCEMARGVWHVYRWRKSGNGFAGTKVDEFLHREDAFREMNRLNKLTTKQ